MDNFNDILIFGPDFNKFSHSLTAAMNSVPRHITKHLRQIFSAYFSRGAFDLVYSRMNDRTVGQILAEFDGAASEPMAKGEVDGVEYRLYDAPKDDSSAKHE